MKQRGRWFDVLMDTAERYVEMIAETGLPHNEQLRGARERLCYLIADGRKARQRDRGLQAAAAQRRKEERELARRRSAPTTLAQAFEAQP
jgi:hypothetical protein